MHFWWIFFTESAIFLRISMLLSRALLRVVCVSINSRRRKYSLIFSFNICWRTYILIDNYAVSRELLYKKRRGFETLHKIINPNQEEKKKIYCSILNFILRCVQLDKFTWYVWYNSIDKKSIKKEKKKKDKKRMEKLIYLFHIDQFRNSRIIGRFNLYKTMSGTYLVYIKDKRYSTNVKLMRNLYVRLLKHIIWDNLKKIKKKTSPFRSIQFDIYFFYIY